MSSNKKAVVSGANTGNGTRKETENGFAVNSTTVVPQNARENCKEWEMITPEEIVRHNLSYGAVHIGHMDTALSVAAAWIDNRNVKCSLMYDWISALGVVYYAGIVCGKRAARAGRRRGC